MGAQRQGGAESPREAEGAVRGWTHLAFVQSPVDHPACAACLAGCEVLHVGAGVADRVKVVQWTGAMLSAGWDQFWSSQVAGGEEKAGRVSVAFLLPQDHERGHLSAAAPLPTPRAMARDFHSTQKFYTVRAAPGRRRGGLLAMEMCKRGEELEAAGGFPMGEAGRRA